MQLRFFSTDNLKIIRKKIGKQKKTRAVNLKMTQDYKFQYTFK